MQSSTQLVNEKLKSIDDETQQKIDEVMQFIDESSRNIDALNNQRADIQKQMQPLLGQYIELQTKMNSLTSVINDFKTRYEKMEKDIFWVNLRADNKKMELVKLLRRACYAGNINLVKALLDLKIYGPKGDIYYTTSRLWWGAISDGDPINLVLLTDKVEMLDLLLSSNLVNIKEREKNREGKRADTLIAEALKCSAKTCALFILNKYDDINPSESVYDLGGKEKCGELLGLALDEGCPEAAEFLIKKGANVDARYENETCSVDVSYTYPLLLAAKKRYVSTVKLLLEYGANPLIRDNEGRTADELTKNPDIKALFVKPESLRDQYENIPGHGPIPDYIASINSDKLMRNPVQWRGMKFDLEDVKEMNQHLPDDKKIDPLGRPIKIADYNVMMGLKTDESTKNRIISFVRAEQDHFRERQKIKMKR